jgi:hypothetical protein
MRRIVTPRVRSISIDSRIRTRSAMNSRRPGGVATKPASLSVVSVLCALRRAHTLRKLANSAERFAEFLFRRETDMDVHLATFRAFESESLGRI